MSASQFAKNILFLRKKRKINQAEIPDWLDIKAATWSNYENGKTEPNIDTIINISKKFGVSIDDLLTIDLEKVQVFGKEGIAKSKVESTGNITGNSTGIDRGKPSDLGFLAIKEDVGGLIVELLKENNQKLEKLIVIAEKKVKF